MLIVSHSIAWWRKALTVYVIYEHNHLISTQEPQVPYALTAVDQQCWWLVCFLFTWKSALRTWVVRCVCVLLVSCSWLVVRDTAMRRAGVESSQFRRWIGIW